MKTEILIKDDLQSPQYFRVIGYLIHEDGYLDKFTVVDNNNMRGELQMSMSSCLPSDIKVAKAIAQLYVDTIAAAEERLQQNKGA